MHIIYATTNGSHCKRRARRWQPSRAELRTWLYRMANNTARMRHRRVKPELVPVHEANEREEGAVVPQALFDLCRLPESELDRAGVCWEPEKAIQAMPEKLRAGL